MFKKLQGPVATWAEMGGTTAQPSMRIGMFHPPSARVDSLRSAPVGPTRYFLVLFIHTRAH
jgi:hypothetical protein